jgi:cysteinyl-tRNA synthetase
MANSTGNYILPAEIFSGENEILSKAFSPNVTRFFMLQAHYRSILDFSNDAILGSEKGFNRLMEGMNLAKQLEPSSSSTLSISDWKKSCYEAMNDDFNTPILIAQLFEGVRFVNLVNDSKATVTKEDLNELQTTLHTFIYNILGVSEESKETNNSDKLEGVVNLMIQIRMEARANKNFALSDQIRDQLLALGIQLKDGKEGTSFTVN